MWYKIFYIVGWIFLGLFFLSSLTTINIIYILISLVCFILSIKKYKND